MRLPSSSRLRPLASGARARRPALWPIVVLALAGCDATSEAPPAVETAGEPAAAAQLCAPDTRCIDVDSDGTPDPEGTSIAQCRGTFPDYVVEKSLFPASYAGPWFELAQDYPTEEPEPGEEPWAGIDFRESAETADEYLYALRDYSFEGNIEADFRPQQNTVRAWYHIPLMNFGPGRRELVHGLTRERTLKHPELGIRQGVSVRNYAIGFYNDLGGYAAGQIWADPQAPDLTKSRFAEGTMVFKILFTAAVPEDFEDPESYIVEGAPEWQIATGNGRLTTVRLLQMDVAVRDDRSGPSGWVYGTFAYDRDAPDESPWHRLRPVGLMWGNDPGYTPADQQAGEPLEEAYVSPEIPAYAAGHLGWAGRVNGPVDNPISACLSCHGTAQYPVDADLAPFSSACETDAQKLYWFRNLAGDEAFGAVDSDCNPTDADPPPVPLDTSLQVQVAVQNQLQYRDVNSCLGVPVEPAAVPGFGPERTTDAPRVMRGGLGG